MVKKQSGFALIPIVLGILVILVICAAVYFLVLNKSNSISSNVPSPIQPAESLLKEEYSNPFEEQSQYQNPFEESTETYTNPFDQL